MFSAWFLLVESSKQSLSSWMNEERRIVLNESLFEFKFNHEFEKC